MSDSPANDADTGDAHDQELAPDVGAKAVRGLPEQAVEARPVRGLDESHGPGPGAIALEHHQGAEERDQQQGAQEADDHAGDAGEEPAEGPERAEDRVDEAPAGRQAELGEEGVDGPGERTQDRRQVGGERPGLRQERRHQQREQDAHDHDQPEVDEQDREHAPDAAPLEDLHGSVNCGGDDKGQQPKHEDVTDQVDPPRREPDEHDDDRGAEGDRGADADLAGILRGGCPGGARPGHQSSPMSSFQMSGCSAMNACIRS